MAMLYHQANIKHENAMPSLANKKHDNAVPSLANIKHDTVILKQNTAIISSYT